MISEIRQTIWSAILILAIAQATLFAAPPSDYYGGAGDGSSSVESAELALGGKDVTLSSAQDQGFYVGQSPTANKTITITDNSGGGVTTAGNLRIRIPEDFNMNWHYKADSSDSVFSIGSKPTVTFNSAVELTNGSGKVAGSVDVADVDGNNTCKLKVEYSTDSTNGTDGNWSDPAIESGTITADFGAPALDNGAEYQIGTAAGWIQTSSGTNSIGFNWLSKTDLPTTDDAAVWLRFTASDGTFTSETAHSTSFSIDNVAPTGLANLAVDSVTSTTTKLTWTQASDNHFNHYEIWYGTVLTDVQDRKNEAGGGTAKKWDNTNDTALASAATTTTTITGLTPQLTYYFKIWAVDNNGNEMTIAHISNSTNNMPVGGYSAVAGNNVIPAAQCVQSTDGSGLITITFRIKDVDLDNCTLKTFKYSVNGGTDWVTLGDSSAALSAYWKTNGTQNGTYSSAADWSGAEHSFTFNTRHADVAGLDNVDQEDVRIQFVVNDGMMDSASAAISDNFRVDNVIPILNTVVATSVTGGGDTIALTFSEPMTASTIANGCATLVIKYSIDASGGYAIALPTANATANWTSATEVTITLNEATDHAFIPNGKYISVAPNANSVKDAFGNSAANTAVYTASAVTSETSVRIISTAGGNWSNTATWVEGSVPTVSDDVVATSASGNVTIDAAAICKSADFTNYIHKLTHNAGNILTIGGGLKFVPGMEYENNADNCTISINGTGAVYTAGKSLGNFTVNGSGITVTLADNFTGRSATQVVTLTQGTLKTDGANDNSGLTHSWGQFVTSNTNTRTLNLGTSTITLTANNGGPWNGYTPNLTLSAASSTIIIAGYSTGGNETSFNLPGTYGTLTINQALQTKIECVNGNYIFTNLTINGYASKAAACYIRQGNITVNGALTLAGNSATNRLLIYSDILGAARTITVTDATTNCSNVDFRDIIMNPRKDFSARTDIGNCGGINGDGSTTGIVPTPAAAQTCTMSTSKDWSDVTIWTSRVPLPQDDVTMTGVSGTCTLTADMPRLGKTIDTSGAGGTFTLALNSIPNTIYGGLNLAGVDTFTKTQSLTFEGRGEFTLTTNGKSFGNANAATSISMVGGKLTLQDDFSMTGGYATNFSLNNGTFDANDKNMNITAFHSSNSNARSLYMGNGEWTVFSFSGGCAWNISNTANLNFYKEGANLTFTNTGTYSMQGGGLTYNNITLNATGTINFTDSDTAFNNFTINAPKTVTFTSGTTHTIIGNFTANGTAPNSIVINSSTADSPAILSKASGAVDVKFCSIKDSTATGGATWTARASTDVSGNSGWVFPAFKTISNTGGNWSSAAAWVEGSAPTLSEDVFATSTSGNVTIDVVTCSAANVDLSYYAGELVHTAGNTLRVYGGLKFSTAMTYAPTSDNCYLGFWAPSGSHTVTFNGKHPGNVNFGQTGSSTASWALLDGLTTRADTTTVTLTSGTLKTDGASDNSGLAHNWGRFDSSNSNTRALTLGNSTITTTFTTGAGNAAWGIWNGSNLILNANTSTLIISGAGSSFNGGGKTYNIVNFTGSGAQFIADQGPDTFSTLTRTGTANKTDGFYFNYAGATVTGTLNLNGNSPTNRLLVYSYGLGAAQTLTVTGATVACSNVDFKDVIMNPRKDFSSQTDIGNCGGINGDGSTTGIVPTPAASQTCTMSASKNWSDATIWTSRVPLPQDDVSMTGVTGGTLTADMPRLGKSIDWTGATGNPTWALNQTNNTIYGGLVLKSTMSVTFGAYTFYFEGRGSFNFDDQGVAFQNINVQMFGGTLTLLSNLVLGSAKAITFSNGTFDADIYNVTAKIFQTSGTAAKAVNMGSGTWTVNNSSVDGPWWNFSSSGMTLNAETSTIVFGYNGNNAQAFVGGGLAYNNLTLTGGGTQTVTFTGANAFNNFTISAPKAVILPASTITTVNGAFSAMGTVTDGITLTSSASPTAQATLALNSAASAAYVAAGYINGTGTEVLDYGGSVDNCVNWTVVGDPALSSGGWTLDMNAGTMDLNFNNTLDASAIFITKIILQDAATATVGKSYTLTGTYTLGTYGSLSAGQYAVGGTSNKILQVKFSATDLNAIKAIANFAKEETNSYIRFDAAAVKDLLGHTNVAVPDGSAVKCATGGYNPDSTGPTLTEWTLNMHTHQLTLTFSEIVKAASWSPTAVTLQNTATSPTKAYALTSGSTLASATDSIQITVNLCAADFNGIIDIPGDGLCTSETNSYITLTTSAITDLAKIPNPVTAITKQVKLGEGGYTPNAVTAAKFKVSTTAGNTMNAGTTKVTIVKAYDSTDFRTPTYTGEKTLVFSGANEALEGNKPKATNKNEEYVDFGGNTLIDFSTGSASITITLYKKELASIKVTEGSISTSDGDALAITVSATQKIKLAFSQQPSSTGTINANLPQQPIVAIRDMYGNQTTDTDYITLYDSDNGSSYHDAPGTLSVTTNPVAAVDGAATFSGVKYSALGIIYLNAQSSDAYTSQVFSNSINFNAANTSKVEAALPPPPAPAPNGLGPVPSFDNLTPTKDTELEKFPVIRFRITDVAGDGVATKIDRLKIAIGGTGGAAHSDIAWAELTTGGGNQRVAYTTNAINPNSIADDSITFGTGVDGQSDADLTSVEEGTSVEYTVFIYMNSSKLTAVEGNTYTFGINESLVETDTGTSSQMASNSNSVDTVSGTIKVDITHFEIVTAGGSTSFSNGTGQATELKIRATDANKNIDKHYLGVKYFIFSGLHAIGDHVPLIETTTAFVSSIGIEFPSNVPAERGISAAGAVTLTAYKAEVADITVAEIGVTPAYAVFPVNATILAGTATSIKKAATDNGDGQTRKVTTVLPTALTIIVEDQYENGVPNQTVGFSVSSEPPGTTTHAVVTPIGGTSTNSIGKLSANLTLGGTRGAYGVTATCGALSLATPFTANALEPTAVSKTSGDVPVQAQAIDTDLANEFVAKLVDGTTGIPAENITFAITSYPTGAYPSGTAGKLTVTSTTTNSDPNHATLAIGEAATKLTLGIKAGTYVVTASSNGFSAIFSATATASSATKIDLTGEGSLAAGSPPPEDKPFVLTVQDSEGNAADVTQDTVFTLSTTPPNTGAFYSDFACTIPVPNNRVTVLSSGSNKHSVSFYYKHTAAGGVTLNAEWYSGQPALSGVSDTLGITITPANLSYFKVTGTTTTMTAGDSRAIVVTAYDAYDNIVTTYNGSTNIVFSGATTSPGTDAQGKGAPTCSSGATDVPFGQDTLLTFNNPSAGKATTTLKVYTSEVIHIKAAAGTVVTSDANALGGTTGVNVKHGDAHHLKYHTDITTPQTAGTAFSCVLDVVDPYANICKDDTRGGQPYGGSKIVTWNISGASNAPDPVTPGTGIDSFTSPVSFSDGQSTTLIGITLYRAQYTTITAAVDGIASATSNEIRVKAINSISKIRFSQQPSTTSLTNTVLAQQPIVAVADVWGNPCDEQTGAQVILTASLSDQGHSNVHGTLSAANLSMNLTNGEAAFTGVKYSYPEAIYLEATVTGYTARYSHQITFSTANDLTTEQVTAGLTHEVSSIANLPAEKTNVYAFKTTDTDTDGYGADIQQIVIHRSASDGTGSTGGWANYLEGVYITDGNSTPLPGTIEADRIYFHRIDGLPIYTLAKGTSTTFTVSVRLKSSTLPVDAQGNGADGRVLGFTMDANDDITLGALGSGFATATAISDSATITVAASRFLITGDTAMSAGGSNIITITAIDKNRNKDVGYAGTHELTFSGANSSIVTDDQGRGAPTCSSFGGSDVAFGAATTVSFSNGKNLSTVTMKLYKAEIAMVEVTDDTTPTALGTVTADALSVTVSGGSAYRLLWNTQPEAKVVVNAPWKEFVIAVTDRYGNTSTSTATITITAGGAPIGGGASVEAVGGLASFTGFSVTSTGIITLTGNSTAVSVNTGPSNAVTVEEKYSVVINAKDTSTNTHLTEVTLQILEGTSSVYGPTQGNSPFTLSLPYGEYSIKLTKEKYVDSTNEKTAGVAADGADGIYDNHITWNFSVTSLEEATADYQVKNSFVYDEDAEDLTIRLWLERRGKLIVDDSVNNLGIATIDIFDDANNNWLNSVTIATDAEGVYKTIVYDVLTANGTLGTVPLVAGKTYYAKCKIYYGGSLGDARSYETGATFTVTITQKLSKEIIGKLGLEAGETLTGKLGVTGSETVAGKIASEGVITRAKVSEVKSETAKILTAAETTIPAKVAEVKSETANILTAAQTTLPAQITETKTAISDVIKSEILNRENAIRSGQAMTIRFRTYTGLSPKLDVYDANNVQRVTNATMKEIGATGVYEYDVTFSTAWGKGDYTIICSEATKKVQDAMTITVGKTDVEQVYNQVSTVVGSTSSIGSLKTVAVNLNSQVSLIETALSKIGKDLTAKVKEAAASAAQLEPVYAQLSSVAKQIKDISGETGLNLEKLYQVSKDKAQDIVYLKNKTQEVKAAIELNQKLVDNIANKPVTQTWYEYK